MTVSLGAHLRELRQRRGISLEEVARVTKVVPRYLEALEADVHTELPAPVFTRGFIRAYCQALGEDPEEALARYDADAPAAETAIAPAPGAPRAGAAHAGPARGVSAPRNRSGILISLVLFVVLGVALLTVALITRAGREGRAGDSQQAATPAPAPAPAPAAEPPPGSPAGSGPAAEPAAPQWAPPPGSPARSEEGPTPGPAVTSAPVPAEQPAAAVAKSTEGLSPPYRLIARVTEPTWIRVQTEGGRTTEETIPAGGVREWVSDRPFVLTIGNAGGVALELNGRALPALGGRGVVIRRLALPADAR